MKLTEVLNVYDLHSDPSKLKGTEDDVPELVWDKWFRVHTNATSPKIKQQSKQKLKQIEPWIISNVSNAYAYARYVIKGRWPEAESVIKSDPEWAVIYAHDVIKGRWPEAESVIKSDPVGAFWYAQNVLNLPEDQAEQWGKS